MHRPLVLLLVAALPLATAAPAAAKEPVRAKVCGASDCVEVKDRSLLFAMSEGGPPGPPPPSAAPWYRATIVIAIGGGHTDSFSLAAVPRPGYLRSRANGAFAWMRMSQTGRVAWRRATRGLEPRPAADLRGLEAPASGTAASARVDEVVQAPADGARSSSAAWPWIAAAAGGLGLLGIVAAELRRRRRRDGGPIPGTDPA